MSNMHEYIMHHVKVMLFLIILTAAAVTLLSHKGPLLTGDAAVASLPAASPNALELLFLFLILMSLILGVYQASLWIGGRKPLASEEGLLKYIILAREQGFSDAHIMGRLVQEGWNHEELQRVAQHLKKPTH